MSDLHKKKSELMVLQTIPSHQGLMKVNRWLTGMVFFLMAVIIIGGFFLVPDSDSIPFKNAETTAADMNPVLSAEVKTLKGQFVGLVSGSIESKLRALEESVRLGTTSTALGTIEDIKNDVQVLKSYSEPVKKEAAPVANAQLMQEMSELKRLVYTTLASCGLMVAAIAGIWLKRRYRLPYKEAIIRHLGKK
ncbi:MAG: hypothetical protein NTV43_09690 [Methylococcales bacterium]|nr:hypothetical protein [Methylococcales bacterium]